MTDIFLQTLAAAGANPNSGSAILIGIAPWLLIFVIFYVLMIRPQQKRVRDHQAAIAAIKKGDEVITGGGIRGKVTKVTDDEAEVEISQGVRVRVVKGTLSQVLTAQADALAQQLLVKFELPDGVTPQMAPISSTFGTMRGIGRIVVT